MYSLALFLPILALISFQSIEVTAEATEAALALGKYPTLAKGGFVNGFEMKYSVKNGEESILSVSTETGGGCTLEQATNDACDLPKASWDDDATIDIEFTMPDPAELALPPDMVPEKVTAFFCFSPPSAKNKKWRKINDIFKKDNSCKLSTVVKGTETQPYVSGGTFSETLKMDPKTPTAFFAIRAYVQCEGQSKHDYCHIVNRWPPGEGVTPATDAVFIPTEVMDSRPTRLYAAVFICCLIGPILFLSFLIYERVFLAKRA